METHNVYLEPSTTEVTLYEKNIRRNIYEVCIQRAEEETQEEFFSRVLETLVPSHWTNDKSWGISQDFLRSK